MFVDVPAVDYLRLGSFDSQAVAAFHKVVLGYGEAEDASWGQYKGVRAGQVFAGVAEQKNRLHGLLDVSGADSQSFLGWSPGGDVRCTRIDLQITVGLAPDYRARDFKDALEAADWSADTVASRVHRRRVELIEGPIEDGEDTVYIGSRTSDRFARVYVKLDDQGKRHLRFEAEFKGDRAAAVYALCVEDGRNVAAILRGEWERIPSVAVAAWQDVGSLLAQFSDGLVVSVPRVAGDMNSRYQWFIDSVFPALRALLSDHDIGWRVRRALEDLLQEVPSDKT